jgi:glycerophosphoryl diester phosphodiesterase
VADDSWLDRRVISYAHQGGAREAPSSTLAAIARAVDLGSTAIELDVHATSDGHLVVCHDPTLDRTTDGSGAIAEHRLDEIEQLDNAYWFVPGEDAQPGRDEAAYPLRGRAPADHGFGVATLEEILVRWPGVVLNLDIKRTAPEIEPYEQALADLLRAHDRTGDVIVASFLDAATDRFSEYAPEIPTSAGTNATAEFYRAYRAGEPIPSGVTRHVALQVPASFQEITLVDEGFVATAHDAGLAVHVWTINERDEMERLLDLGVDGIISDVPSVLVKLLADRGVGWEC